MNTMNSQPCRATEPDLKRLVEPLAVYLCAVDNPMGALLWALVILSKQVSEINGAAKAHIAVLSQSHLG